MKVKDLLEFNPDADIKVIMPNYVSWGGKLDFGWSGNDGDCVSEHVSKSDATEVCIFLGDLNENVGNA